MNIKTAITGFIVGLSLVGLNMSSAQAIPLTMSFNIGTASGVIKYDATPTLEIDTLTFADITIGSSTYGTGDVGGTGYTVFNTSGDDFLLTFDPSNGTGILASGPIQDNGQQIIEIGKVGISTTVPEPATLALLGLGLTLLGGASRKRN